MCYLCLCLHECVQLDSFYVCFCLLNRNDGFSFFLFRCDIYTSYCGEHSFHYLFSIDMESLNAELLQCTDPESYLQKLERYYQSVSTAHTVFLFCGHLYLEGCLFRVRNAFSYGGYLSGR